MSPHEAGCDRGKWLLRRREEFGWSGMFWIVAFSEGPPCTCSAGGRLFSSEQSPARDG